MTGKCQFCEKPLSIEVPKDYEDLGISELSLQRLANCIVCNSCGDFRARNEKEFWKWVRARREAKENQNI